MVTAIVGRLTASKIGFATQRVGAGDEIVRASMFGRVLRNVSSDF